MRRCLTLGAAIVAACGGAATTLSHHATTTVGDATYAVPEAWRVVRTEHELVTLEDPDRAVRVTIVATTGDAKAAIGQAWRRVEPAFALDGELDEPPPAGGWDAITTIDYAMPAAAARAARAVWRRHGVRGYVVLIDGERNALDRRDAQIETIVSSPPVAGATASTRVSRALVNQVTPWRLPSVARATTAPVPSGGAKRSTTSARSSSGASVSSAWAPCRAGGAQGSRSPGYGDSGA